VDVKRVTAVATSRLGQCLLVRQPALSTPLLHLASELPAATEGQADSRVILQGPPDTGQRVHRLDTEGTQLVGSTDTGAEQYGRRAVGTGRHHDALSLDTRSASVVGELNGRRPPADDLDPLDQRVADNAQVAPLTHRIEVSEGGVPAHAFADVHWRVAHFRNAVGVVEVVHADESRRCAGLDKQTVERAHLVGLDLPDTQSRTSAFEGWRDAGPVPTGIAQLSPGVVITAMASQCHAPVV
jgi:hypothetical protein